MNKSKLITSISLLLIGMIIFFLRNPDPILNPILYAEDGVWAGQIMSNGFWNTIFNTREDYFVALNLMFLDVAIKFSLIIFEDIKLLPYCIAWLSYFFYSIVALITYIFFSYYTNQKFAILAWTAVCLMAIGPSQNEIIGRLLQIGFFMPYCTMLLLFIKFEVKTKFVKSIIDLSIILACATNPIVFLHAAIFFLAVFIFNRHQIRSFINDNALLICLMATLAVISAFKMFTATNLEGGLTNIPFNPRNLIEALTTRAILFPLVFSVYDMLGSATSILFAFLYILLCTFGLKLSQHNKIFIPLLCLVISLFILDVITIFMRPGLTFFFNNFTNSGIDRYFMGINVFSIAVLILISYSLSLNSNLFKITSYLLLTGYVFNLLININYIFEYSHPKLNLAHNSVFIEDLDKASCDKAICTITIKPKGWTMQIPSSIVEDVKIAPK